MLEINERLTIVNDRKGFGLKQKSDIIEKSFSIKMTDKQVKSLTRKIKHERTDDLINASFRV